MMPLLRGWREVTSREGRPPLREVFRPSWESSFPSRDTPGASRAARDVRPLPARERDGTGRGRGRERKEREQEKEEEGRRIQHSSSAAALGPRPTMIKAILIFNNHGKPRLSKFYQRYSEDTQQQIIRETFHLVSKRDENVCNFLEGGLLIGGSDNKLIYRHYATLYFVFCVDSSESELGILDLIQVFVETLDKCFENVCELDLIFHVDKVHNILAEMVMGGMVLETNMNEIVTQIDAQNKLEKSEAGLAGAPARAVSAVKNMNLPEIPRNINIGDISIKVPNLPTFK
uniref:Adaptor related protein complex 3 subunit sigma 1 n=1 Tax=Cyanoderma ruficeps TaxID=181631 RepID=A0A8C3NYG5_9PASS